MKCLSIQHENVNRGHAATIIATNIQNSIPFHGPDMSSPFISRLDNCLLYTRQDRTQTLLQLVFQKFPKIIQSGLCLSFCCKFFHWSVGSKSSNSYRF